MKTPTPMARARQLLQTCGRGVAPSLAQCRIAPCAGPWRWSRRFASQRGRRRRGDRPLVARRGAEGHPRHDGRDEPRGAWTRPSRPCSRSADDEIIEASGPVSPRVDRVHPGAAGRLHGGLGRRGLPRPTRRGRRAAALRVGVCRCSNRRLWLHAGSTGTARWGNGALAAIRHDGARRAPSIGRGARRSAAGPRDVARGRLGVRRRALAVEVWRHRGHDGVGAAVEPARCSRKLGALGSRSRTTA